MDGPRGVSGQGFAVAKASRAVRLCSTTDVAKRIGVRSMTLMRWIVDRKIPSPCRYAVVNGQLHWLWEEEEVAPALAFRNRKKRPFPF